MPISGLYPRVLPDRSAGANPQSPLRAELSRPACPIAADLMPAGGYDMNSVRSSRPKVVSKASTGIVGFDEITGGGLPRGRTTLLVGGPGSGKTVFALQYLINGARSYGEPGIFVAF